MEPFSVAVCVFAHDHFSVGGTSTVAVPRFIRIVLPLAAFHSFPERFFASFLSQEIVIALVEASLMQFLIKFLGGLVNEVIEFLSDVNFLFGLGIDFCF